METPDGPYLAFALLCERVLIEKDGNPSLVRVFDTVAAPAGIPVTVDAFICVGFKSLGFKGDYRLNVAGVDPNGKELFRYTKDLALDGEQHGSNYFIRVDAHFDVRGLYRFIVTGPGEKLLSVIPFRVRDA